MAWKPKGKCYAFCESSIVAYAPEHSGVFGLYNSDYQLFIGESSNIRASLLEHLSEGAHTSSLFQPTCFAFESCGEDVRLATAQRLIEEYKPVRQSDWPLADSWEIGSDANKGLDYNFTMPVDAVIDADDQVPRAGEEPLPTKARSYFGRGQLIGLGVATALVLGGIFFFGAAGESLSKNEVAEPAPLTVAGERQESNLPSDASADKKAEVRRDESLPAANSVPPPSRENRLASRLWNARDSGEAPVSSGKQPAAAPLATEASKSGVSRTAAPEPIAAEGIKGEPKEQAPWTVQVAANPEKSVTDKQVAELQAKGYDAYLTETARDGRTWYRVRVGRFADRAQADSLREVLASREGYRSPFIARD